MDYFQNKTQYFSKHTIDKSFFILCLFLSNVCYAHKLDYCSVNVGTPQDLTHYDRMVKFHKRMDWSVDNSQILFVGDSMIQSMNVSYITNSGVNYSISGDTIN